MFLLVEFIDEKNLAVVPEIWCDGNKCAVWPCWKNPAKIISAVKKQLPPADDWKSFPIREIYRHESYDKVRSKLKRAEEESDVATAQSDSSNDDDIDSIRMSKRKRRPTVQTSSDEESDMEMSKQPQTLPNPPSIAMSPKPLPSLPRPPTPLQLSNTSVISREQPGSCSSPLLSRPSPSNKTGQDIRMVTQLFTQIEKVINEQQQQRKILENILQRVNDSTHAQVAAAERSNFSTPETISLPIATNEELEEAERELQKPNIMENMINYLSLVGGKTVADMIRRVCSQLLRSQVAKEFNWYGMKGKRPFGALQVAVVVRRAVQKQFKETTNAGVEFVVREWLRTASDREGGRKRRKQKPEEEQ